MANNDSASVARRGTVTIAVLANDTDADGDSPSIHSTVKPRNGSITVNSNGTITYKPKGNFTGTDSFQYRATDGTASSNLATVTVTVGGSSAGPGRALGELPFGFAPKGYTSLFSDTRLGSAADADDEDAVLA